MSVLMIGKMNGDPEDLVERYREQQRLLYEEFEGAPPGYLAHVCAKTGDGIIVANVVASEETVWELRPRFEKTADAVGLPKPEIDVFPVVNALAQEIAPSVT